VATANALPENHFSTNRHLPKAGRTLTMATVHARVEPASMVAERSAGRAARGAQPRGAVGDAGIGQQQLQLRQRRL
jgi:hypothetical protein